MRMRMRLKGSFGWAAGRKETLVRAVGRIPAPAEKRWW